MISQTGLNKTAAAISGLIDHARYTLDGVEKTVAIHKMDTVANTISIYVLLDVEVVGTITKVELIDTDGEVYASQPDNIQKIDTKLLLVTFKFTFVEVVKK